MRWPKKRFWKEVSGYINDAEPNLSGVLKRIRMQINHLCDVGLSHLSLYRRTPTVSGGELQRLFLASHLESELEGLVYVFDEPTVGLHEKEKNRLIKRLKELQNQGNSGIVVEHDLGVIRAADWIIEIRPVCWRRRWEYRLSRGLGRYNAKTSDQTCHNP